MNVKKMLENVNQINASIVVDWLSIYYTYNADIDITEENNTFVIDDDTYILLLPTGTQHFNKRCKVIYKSEDVATIMFQSRNEKIFKKDVFKIDYRNETLYSGLYQTIHKIFLNFGFYYKSISRLDIAIDGCNYLIDFLNLYIKQNKFIKRSLLKYRLSNINSKRNVLSPRVYNPKTMQCENFTIGATNSKKYITIYNKSLEISKSGKDYIIDYWYKNGVITKHPSQYNYKTDVNIYRFELRLNSEAVGKIKDLKVEDLSNFSVLAGIVKRHSNNYFEAVNIATGEKHPLLPFEKFKAVNLSYIKHRVNAGMYKAKLTVHGLINDIYRFKINTDTVNEVVEVIFDRLHKYNLYAYLHEKLPEWDAVYKHQIPRNRENDVYLIIDEIEQRNNYYLMPADYKQKAFDNRQAFATAMFRE